MDAISAVDKHSLEVDQKNSENNFSLVDMKKEPEIIEV